MDSFRNNTIGGKMGVFGSDANSKWNPGTLQALNYLNGVDTSDYDAVLDNFQNLANNMSQNSNLGNWNWSVDGSDDARQRAEAATFQSYLDKTSPVFQQQTDDLQTRLVNQGLTPGNEAYQRAITDLQNNQNDATNQAAYQSTLAGQQAFSNSLGDEINAGNFGNQAQTGYTNQIWNLLQNSMSGYDKNMAIANLLTGGYNQQKQAEQTKQQSQDQMINSLMQAGMIAAMASDERLKENIKLVGKLNNGMNVYCFNYKGQNQPQIGLIAQEVQKIKPEAVVENEDGYLMLRYDLATED